MHGPSCRPRQNGPNRGMEEEEEEVDGGGGGGGGRGGVMTNTMSWHKHLPQLSWRRRRWHISFSVLIRIWGAWWTMSSNISRTKFKTALISQSCYAQQPCIFFMVTLIISLQPWSMTIAIHWSVCWEHGYDAMQCIEVPCRIANSWASRGGF